MMSKKKQYFWKRPIMLSHTIQDTLILKCHKKYGKLKVDHYDKLHGVYVCECECGNIITVKGYNLLNGNTQSCGCLKSKGEFKLNTLLTEMGVNFQSVELSSAKGKWGSCSYDNKIRYAYRLIYAPREMIEYVVVHELSHVRHKNHSKAFWTEVAKYTPDWKAKRQWLKTHGYLLEIF